MAGGAISPPIFRAALRMDVPGSTSIRMLSMVTLNIFFSSAIVVFSYLNSCHGRFQGICVVGEPKIPYLTFLRIEDMPFEFVPEVPDRCGHRPGSGIAQGANGIAF